MINTKDGMTEINGTLDELMTDIIASISATAITVGTTPDNIIEAVQEWYEDVAKEDGPNGWKEGFEDVEEEGIIQEKRSREAMGCGIQERIRGRRSHHYIS